MKRKFKPLTFEQIKATPESETYDVSHGDSRTALVAAYNALVAVKGDPEDIATIACMLQQHGCEDAIRLTGDEDGYLTSLCDVIMFG